VFFSEGLVFLEHPSYHAVCPLVVGRSIRSPVFGLPFQRARWSAAQRVYYRLRRKTIRLDEHRAGAGRRALNLADGPETCLGALARCCSGNAWIILYQPHQFLC